MNDGTAHAALVTAREAYRRANPHLSDELDEAFDRHQQGIDSDPELTRAAPDPRPPHVVPASGSEQITLDVDAGRALRDEGMARADGATDPDWKHAAEQALADLIDAGGEFTADDIWLRVGFKPSEPRALGAILSAASRRGDIVQTGARRPSARPEHHAFPMAVWRRRPG